MLTLAAEPHEGCVDSGAGSVLECGMTAASRELLHGAQLRRRSTACGAAGTDHATCCRLPSQLLAALLSA